VQARYRWAQAETLRNTKDKDFYTPSKAFDSLCVSAVITFLLFYVEFDT
jgi:hypothetical protein